MTDAALRGQLARLLEWEDAHAGFDAVIAGVPSEARGIQPPGLPYSLWQLLEHLRLAQRDILEFCTDPAYRERNWPADYWPSGAAPPTPAAWDDSVRQFQEDRRALQALAGSSDVDLMAEIPHGQGQTYLRELVLAADHCAYHVGEMVLVRRLLGNWGR